MSEKWQKGDSERRSHGSREDRREMGWHLKKEVPIATIITVLLAIGSGTLWLNDIRNDIDSHWQVFGQHVVQQDIDNGRQSRQDHALLAKLEEIRKDIVLIKVALARKD